MNKAGFLQDENGNKSITRIAFILLIIYACLITTLIVVKSEYVYAISMFTTVTGVAFGGKLYQKHQENGRK